MGLAQTVSRIGAVLSPMVASAYFAMKPLPGVELFFWFVAVCAFITTVSFFLIPSHIPTSRSHKTGGGELEVEALKSGAVL